jgi:hypothetical protein
MKYDMNNPSSSNINEIPDSNNKNPIWKKVIGIGQPPAMLVFLHESIVNELAIDEKCWLRQIVLRDGIFLRVSREPADNQMEGRGV